MGRRVVAAGCSRRWQSEGVVHFEARPQRRTRASTTPTPPARRTQAPTDEGGTLELRHVRGQVRSLLERTCTDELLCIPALDGAAVQGGVLVEERVLVREDVPVREVASP